VSDELSGLRERAKLEIRKRMKTIRGLIPISACEKRSAQICQRVLNLPELSNAKTVMGYVAMNREADPRAILLHVLQLGGTAVLPRIVGPGTLSLHRWTADQTLRRTPQGLLEPESDAEQVEEKNVDLVIVPCLGVDPRGHRIGYGRGYYDRLLPRLTAAHKVAIAYDFQLLAEAPYADHDAPVDHIVTDKHTLLAQR
jgi:5-formyltetrahydrofolate cyclo-ligase